MADGTNSSDGRSKVSESEILTAVSRGLEGTDAPALSTSEIADLLPISRQATKRRLDKLKDKGDIKQSTAGQNRFWWLPDKESDRSGTDSLDLDRIVEPGDLSDEVVVELVQSQLQPDTLPDEVADEIVEARLELRHIDREILIDAVERSLDPEDLPEDYAKDLAETRFEYSTTYWAKQFRAGKDALVGFVFTGLLTYFLTSAGVPSISLPLLPQSLIGTLIRGAAVVSALFSAALLCAGLFLLGVGLIGRQIFSVDDPRPWRGYLTDLFN